MCDKKKTYARRRIHADCVAARHKTWSCGCGIRNVVDDVLVSMSLIVLLSVEADSKRGGKESMCEEGARVPAHVESECCSRANKHNIRKILPFPNSIAAQSRPHASEK